MTGKDIDVQKVLSAESEPYEYYLSNEGAILYSLSIGFQRDAMNEDHYKWTYENAEDFGAFPSNAVTIAHRGA